ncbi:MAG: initiation factor 2B [Halobacteriota archaeon]|uniref:initiation factor 2B n=1 Tax=Natronomonas sp. TaxID=2184060 RepID=UPI00397575C7
MPSTDRAPFATIFFRHDAAVLLTRYHGSIEVFEGAWDAVTVPISGTSTPIRDRLRARPEIPSDATLVEVGEPYSIPASDNHDVVTLPVLFECQSRAFEIPGAATDAEWIPPTEILRRETRPGLWEAYDRVRPTPETLRTDTEHGSGYISIRAMEVVRDAAGAIAGGEVHSDDEWTAIAGVAEEVLAARPSMAAVANRVNRVLWRASDDRRAAAVESRAIEELESALRADERAAREAASIVDDAVVLTLSRSGTVLPALRGGPERVLIAESRPAREGIEVAERVSDSGTDVTVFVDAAIAHVLAEERIDAVVFGADTVLRDGTLVNKVGSRGAAIAAGGEEVPVYAVTATDKISPSRTPTFERGPAEEIYRGEHRIDVANPTFDATPPSEITGFVTEDGLFEPSDVTELAATHAEHAVWNRP